jgi:hypothetical protein
MARLIVMDEPNSSLSDADTERLFSVIASLKERGANIFCCPSPSMGGWTLTCLIHRFPRLCPGGQSPRT